MSEFLQELLGDNWETIFASASGLVGVISLLGYKWIKNKSIGVAITTVSGFFTKDMTQEESTEFATILKSVASRKSLKILNNLITQLERFDTEEIKAYVGDSMSIISAILKVMLDNKAFDDNPTLKITLEDIIAKYI